MVFSSSIFLFYFLPIFLLLYISVGKKYKNYVILFASILFYSWGAPKFIFVILASTIVDFFIVKKLHKSENRKTRKQLLSLSIFLNLGLLAYFKYANFFVENVNQVLLAIGVTEVGWTQVALPIGISFYTFQTLTYSIDVYRNVHAPLRKVSDYLLYILSFPQMIAGPIVRFSTVADEIENRPDKLDDKLFGFYRFAIGLAKKILIANVMAEQADAIFNSDLKNISTAQAWLGMLAYTFQIYFDFSGYSDMAIGLGRMMGFHFPENFNSPYTSKSITEFWRRWHITLGTFMRDYLYIPLGGNKVNSNARLYFNLSLVFLLSGLWHGASWNFVLWGAYHGMFLILDRLFLQNILQRAGNFVALLFTFLFTMFGWVIFKIESLAGIKTYFYKLFSFNVGAAPNVNTVFLVVLLGAVVFSFLTAFATGKKVEAYVFSSNQFTNKKHIVFTCFAILLLVVSSSVFTASDFNPFIYFRF